MSQLTDLDLCFQVRNTTTGAVVAWCQATGAGRYEVRHGDGRAETHADRWSAVIALARLVDDNPHPAAAGEPEPQPAAGYCARCGRGDVRLVTLAGAADSVRVCADPAGCAGAPAAVVDPHEQVIRVYGSDDEGQDAHVRLTMAEAARLRDQLAGLLVTFGGAL